MVALILILIITLSLPFFLELPTISSKEMEEMQKWIDEHGDLDK
jgi:hypothetical protein